MENNSLSIPENKNNFERKNLAKKFVKIMDSVGIIPKNGYNAGQGFFYATDADICSALSKALVKHGVCVFVNLINQEVKEIKRNGKDGYITYVTIETTFVDSDSGESITLTGFGQGYSPTDKGIYSAITGAQKYIYLKTFVIETGDDPEKDSVLDVPPDYAKMLDNAYRSGKEAFKLCYKTIPPEKQQQYKALMLEYWNKFKKQEEKKDAI